MCRRSTCLSSRGALRQQRQQGPANTGGANSDYETGTHADCYDWPAVLLGATNGATLGASLAVKHPASPRCEHGNWCAFRRCICSGKTRPASWGSSSGVLWRSFNSHFAQKFGAFWVAPICYIWAGPSNFIIKGGLKWCCKYSKNLLIETTKSQFEIPKVVTNESEE